MKDFISLFLDTKINFLWVLEMQSFFFLCWVWSSLEEFPFHVFCSYSSCEGANHSREGVDFSTSFCTLFVDFSLKAKMAKQFVKVALVVARSGTGLYLMVIDYGDGLTLFLSHDRLTLFKSILFWQYHILLSY